ncbi:hypothetical protein ACSFC1_02120 [Pseudothermotoga sp. U03pept]|uniref:hypothetical protein n=1 Tax=Pseudothermotoga sp. U03pept TaxID=3447012 RepID=UPI003F01855E
MKELLTLLKYGLRSPVISPKKTNRKRISNLLFPILAVSVYGIPLSMLFYETFKSIAQIHIGKYNLASIIVVQWSALMALMFVLSFFPSLVSTFVKNDEIRLLLTMPIRRSTIVLYQAILTLITQSIVVVMYLFVVPSYALSTGKSLVLAVVSSVLMCLVLLFLSILLASIFGLWMSRSSAKKMNILSLILTVAVFVLVTQLLPNLVSKTNTGTLPGLINIGERLLSPFNPVAWPIIGLENPIYIVFLLTSLIMLWFASLKVSEGLEFEEKGIKQKRKSVTTQSHGGIFFKDLRLMIRHERGIFMLIYPVVFSVIFVFTTNSFTTPLFITIIISTMYVSLNTAILMKQEFLSWPFMKLLPIDCSKVLMPKLIIPAGLYSVISSGLVVFLQIYFKVPWMVYLLIPLIFVMYTFAAVFGLNLLLKEREKTEMENPAKILSTGHVFLIEGVVIALALGMVLPVTLYIYARQQLFSLFKTNFLVILLGIGLPVLLCLILIFIIFKYVKKLSLLIDRIE